MENLHLLVPEMALSAMALGILVCDMLLPAHRRRMLYHITIGAAAVTLFLVCSSLIHSTGVPLPLDRFGVGTLWTVDPLGQFFKVLVLLTTILALLLGLEYDELPVTHAGTFGALMLLSALGMMFLVTAVDFLLLFIALELVSISSFILAGFERNNPKSNEGAMKYFLFGAFSSAIMAYGISLYYGAVGTTSLLSTGGEGPLYLLGLLFILVGFGFKASIAPMHFWVPDAYEGAPTPVTAFLSVAPKIAAMGTLLRVFSVLIPAASLDLTVLFSLLAALTMTIGNFTALLQTNVKRLLAYSSIAQAGYILIGIVTGTALGVQGVMLYSFVYVTMNIGIFAVVIAVANQASGPGDRYDLSVFDGLASRSFGMALATTVFLLSLAGIPPLAGFIGKFYIFSSAIESGFYGLAVIGVINSVVSVYYYLYIVYRMFFLPAKDTGPIPIGPYLYGGIAFTLAAVLLFGIYPEPIIAGVQASALVLP